MSSASFAADSARKNNAKKVLKSAIKGGFGNSPFFTTVKGFSKEQLSYSEDQNNNLILEARTPNARLLAEQLQDQDYIAERMARGDSVNIKQKMSGRYVLEFLPPPKAITPRIFIVEQYRLSSYLGDYGAGRTIKTFSLLPGEQTQISIRTYKETEQTKKESTSILDSYSEESADEFESSVEDEQSTTDTQEESKEFYLDSSVSGGFKSFIQASLNIGMSKSSNSSREEFSKNTSKAVNKHSNKASSKRDVNVETSLETREKAGEEKSIVRDIKNINVGRTLNFVFRQINQEFITLLHLTDVRVAFFNGYAKSKKEVPLYEIDSLLNECIVDATNDSEDAEQEINPDAHRLYVKYLILGSLLNVKDYQNKSHIFAERNFVNDKNGIKSNALKQKEADFEELIFQLTSEEGYTDRAREIVLELNEMEKKMIETDGPFYWRVPKDKVSVYDDGVSARKINVSGIITSAQKNVMRTDGVVVEALLGQANALDYYSGELQKQEIRERDLKNDLLDYEKKKIRKGIDIVENNAADAATIFEKVFDSKNNSVHE